MTPAVVTGGTGARSPLLMWPATAALLPMRYGATIEWWAKAAACGTAIVDTGMRYNKRLKQTHRMDICDTHGRLQLTIPVSLPERHSTERPLQWGDIGVSAHGRWWAVHLTALESAYGRTPFFQYYIDRFLPVFSPVYTESTISLWKTLEAVDSQISDILGIPAPRYLNLSAGPSADTLPADVKDYRSHAIATGAAPVEYYQVRSSRFGFMPGLSILDLIFNMGPESPLVLKKVVRSLTEP